MNNNTSSKSAPASGPAYCLTALATFIFLVTLLTSHATQAASCTEWVASILSVQGLAEQRVTENDQQKWQAVATGHRFCTSDVLRVRANSRVALRLNNDTVVRLNEHTTITFTSLNRAAPSSLELEKGIAHFISRVKRAFRIITPFVNAAIEGTEFVVAVGNDQAAVTVFEGKVRVENDKGRILLTKGQTALADKDQAPVLQLLVKPRNAVQWALHYPVVIDRALAATATTSQTPSLTPSRQMALPLTLSLALFRQGKTDDALKLIEPIDTATLNAETATYRATLWLTTGHIDRAQTDIEHALRVSSNFSEALALQGTIALTQNRISEAAALAQQAIDSDRQNTSGYLALSHVRQAQFDLTGALAALEDASNNASNNASSTVSSNAPGNTAETALLLSRRAELTLMLGNPADALTLAARAANTNPFLSHAQSIIGFALLIRNNPQAARIAFDTAARLDQSDPLPRLGSGLVAIRDGDLEAGREDIEFAASLDPDNALIRSYLGKAYYEENRSKLASDQFDMAKALDPLDPTPWFYSAINRQGDNRPAAALRDIRQSTALNDNRAVYRSRQQLDQDSAARNASVARIYRDLGFDQLALQQAWRSLDADASSHSAHRFLADAYAHIPRHEIARVSELLQSQLLQPLNSNPVQPQLAESNLGILEGAGPADASSVELNPLFTRNGLRYQFDSLLAAQNTQGGDVLLSGIHNSLAFSVGHFYYSSDGFRNNNDLEHNIDSAFVQTQLTTSVSVQAEIRHQETENGDLLLQPDPDNVSDSLRYNTDTDTRRLGLHYRPAPTHDVIASYIRRTRDYIKHDTETVPGPAPGIDVLGEENYAKDTSARVNELQYQHHGTPASIIAGLGYANIRDSLGIQRRGTLLPPSPPTVVLDTTSVINFDSENKNAYLYSTLTPQPDLSLTMGMSWVSYQQGLFDIDGFNPRLGASWQVLPSTQLRAAAFSVLQRPLVSGQTIEPTHIAGFNQFFDDTNGTESKRYGLAVGHDFNARLSGGIEATRRTLDQPTTSIVNGTVSSVAFFSIAEQMHRAYLYWVFNDDWSVSGEYFLERLTDDSGTPRRLKTHRVPLGIQYHAADRIRAGLTASYYRQDANINGDISEDDFWIVDASSGYRLSKRAGLISAGVKNLFDRTFSFYNQESTGDPRPLLFQPKRSVYFALTLTFQ